MTPTPSTRTAKTHVSVQPPIIYWNRLLRYERITPMTGGDARAQTVVRALTLLGRFSAEEPEHTATELSVATGITVPTTHRLLKTLASKSFLVLDPESKKYSLGPAVVQLAGAVLGRDNLLELVDPVLIELRRFTGSLTTRECASPNGLGVSRSGCPLAWVAVTHCTLVPPGRSCSPVFRRPK